MQIKTKQKKRIASLEFIFLGNVLLLLSACGFHPVYGVNKYTPVGAETKLQSIEISNIPDREGQFLRNELVDRLHRSNPSAPKNYTLKISKVNEYIRELDITIDADTTRAQLSASVSMELIDNKTRENLLNRTLNSTASYNVLGSEFANSVSEQTTRENVLKDLARQIELELALYFKRPPEEKEPPKAPLRLPNAR